MNETTTAAATMSIRCLVMSGKHEKGKRHLRSAMNVTPMCRMPLGIVRRCQQMLTPLPRTHVRVMHQAISPHGGNREEPDWPHPVTQPTSTVPQLKRKWETRPKGKKNCNRLPKFVAQSSDVITGQQAYHSVVQYRPFESGRDDLDFAGDLIENGGDEFAKKLSKNDLPR
ncbi:hypothetical protein [Stackebrandtia nassauensis]|uniref:hypothetical protein n=1 Tax=Stackebrandtia nassauensis TaxID=283811 RepID=UPI0011857193|nr:hypothetical protein [Stackebrandtia nassauensis]